MSRAGKGAQFQLLRGDPFNLTLGGLLMTVLAAVKHCSALPAVVRWHLSAYTNWNLIFCTVRLVLKQKQWDPFLLCNSMGILCGFRAALVQGLDENLRDKINTMGPPVSRLAFKLGDHVCHTVPALALLWKHVNSREHVPHGNSAAAIMLGTWFAFRQGAKLDAAENYVPHPWRHAWLGIMLGATMTPALVDTLVARRYIRSLLCIAVMMFPWLMGRIDGTLKERYDFEYALQKARSRKQECECHSLLQTHEKPLRRISTFQ